MPTAGKAINPTIVKAKARKIRRVRQKDRSGCGIACVAMLAGESYATVRKAWIDRLGGNERQLTAVGNGAGLTHGDMLRLCELFAVRLCIADAPVVVLTKIDNHCGHYVIVNEAGRVLDPAD